MQVKYKTNESMSRGACRIKEMFVDSQAAENMTLS